jgi:transposase
VLELLLSIPGIGELTARTLLAEIETIHRFADPEKLISYAGLAPRMRQSAGMDRRGALTKRGSVWLRTALVESAQIAVPTSFTRSSAGSVSVADATSASLLRPAGWLR